MALCVGTGRSGYNNTQQGKTNVLQPKASWEERPSAGDGWRAVRCGGGLHQDPDPGADPQGEPGSPIEIASCNTSRSCGALPWRFTRREICADRLTPSVMAIYRDLIFMGAWCCRGTDLGIAGMLSTACPSSHVLLPPPLAVLCRRVFKRVN